MRNTQRDVNHFSRCKGLNFFTCKCYTTFEISYIIHTFGIRIVPIEPLYKGLRLVLTRVQQS
jgi:hypothetical protein